MTTQTTITKTFWQQFGTLLTGNREAAAYTEVASRTRPHADDRTLKVISVVAPFSPPTVFTDYAAEGDEPADLALTELIPADLAALNLPGTRPQTQDSQPPIAAGAITTGHPSTALSTKAMIEDELTELIPLNLSSLNQVPQRPQPKETDLEQNQTHQGSNHQGPNHHQTSQPKTHHPSTNHQSTPHPLPDLATLRRADGTTSVSPNDTTTLRIPTAHLEQLSQIVDGLIHQQKQQARHNEQLGALVKQLLSRIAQQQTELNRLGKGDYSNVQQMIQTCLTSSTSNDWIEFSPQA